MMRHRFMVRGLGWGCAALCGVLPAPAGEVPERSADGQTLLVPKDHQTLGEVYYVLPGAGTQLTWETDAPLLRLVATCDRVVGYFVAPFEFENGSTPLLAGALRAPVASLSTGYEQSDATLHAPNAFDRGQHPEILFSIVSAGPARNVAKENNREQCEFDLVGEMTVKNKTMRFESPARLALLPFTRATEPFSPSDLLILRTAFKVSLAEIGISTASAFGQGFAGEHAEVGLFLMGTTIHPRKNFDPRINDEQYVKQLKFMTQLRDFNDPLNAYVLGRALMKEVWGDARMLNDLAWAVLTDEDVKRRDLAFVEEAAKRANELTEHKDPQYLSTLARVCYERGDLDAALKSARKAVENLPGQPFFVGPPIRAALEGYEAEARQRQPAPETPEEE